VLRAEALLARQTVAGGALATSSASVGDAEAGAAVFARAVRLLAVAHTPVDVAEALALGPLVAIGGLATLASAMTPTEAVALVGFVTSGEGAARSLNPIGNFEY
jgi:hypothetical protein